MTQPAPPAPARRPSRRRIALFWLVGIALAATAADLLVGNFDEVLGAFDLVDNPRVSAVLLAVAAEVASYVAYAGAEKLLLRESGFDVGLPRLTLLNVATQALGVCLPAGYAFSNVFSYRLLRRWRVAHLATLRVLVATSALYVAALALLALAGAQVASGGGPVGEIRTVAYVLLGLVALLAAGAIWRRRQLTDLVVRLVRGVDRRFPALRRGRAPLPERLEREIGEAHSLSPLALAGAGFWLVLAWLADLGCLAASFLAVHAAVPWDVLLLAYCAGQISALLPITPGGLGVVEGSLTFALVNYGGSEVKTVAAVLLYRLISFWGLLPSGGACYLLLRQDRSAAEVVD